MGRQPRKKSPANEAHKRERRAALFVGLGASAGGLEPLEQFFDNLPADSGLVVVVVQHLEPHRPSLLVDLLARHALVPVIEAADGVRPEPDRAYVIAPGTMLTLEGGAFRVTAADEPTAHAPIDALFRSLAEDQGEHSVGVVFSGAGHDGTVGLRAIKERGGLTLAQSPGTAKHDSMPQSAIEAGLVDHVLAPEQMAAKLLEHAGYVATVEAAGTAALDTDLARNLRKICALVQQQTGHDFAHYKEATLLRRIRRRMQVLHVVSVDDYLQQLEQEPAEAESLVKDLLIGSPDLFDTADKKSRTFRRKETVVGPTVDFPLSARSAIRPVQLTPTSATRDPSSPTLQQKVSVAFERMALDEYTAPCAAVNGSGDLVLVAGRLGRYFQIPSGAVTTNLVELVPASLRVELRMAMHAAATTRRKVVRDNVAVELDDGMHRVRLTVRPVPGLEPGSGLLAVVVQEHAPLEEPEEAREPIGLPEQPALDRLEGELRTTRATLKTTVEDLESANEELKSSNEELISTNEELQSANEELQTSKEELQSLNEELETVNTELRQRVEEVGAANSDLANLFVSTEVATIFLDRDLRVAKFTPAATELFHLIERDVGRPIGDFAPRFEGQDLVADAREVLRTLSPIERQVRAANGESWFILRVLPYRTVENVIAGVVVTFVDVTALKRAQEALAARAAELEGVLDSMQDAVVVFGANGRAIRTNPAARALSGVDVTGPDGVPIGAVEMRIRRPDGSTMPVSEFPSRRALRGITVTREPYLFVGRHGEERVGEASATPLVVEGRIVGAVNVARDITEVKHAEEALRQSEERFRLLVEGVRDYAILMLAPDGTVATWNLGAERLKGYRAEEIIGQHFSRFYTEDDVRAGKPQRELDAALAAERTEDEGWRVRKDGSRFWASVLITAVRDQAGRLRGFSKIIRDFTERKQAEEAVSRTHRTFSELIERAPFGIYVVDSRFRVAQMNAGSQTGAFRNVRPIIGRDFAEAMRILWPEPVAADIIAVFRHTLETGEPYYSPRFVNPRHDVEAVEAYEWELHRMTLPDGHYGVICYYFDSTRLREAEAALRESEDRLRQAQAVARVGTFEWNVRTDVNTWTPEMEAMYGLPAGGFSRTQTAWENLVHPDDRAEAVRRVERAFETGVPVEGEWRVVWPDGSVHWLAGRFQAFKDESGKPLRLTGVNIDISHLKHAEEELRGAKQRMESLLENSPLAVIEWSSADYRIVRWSDEATKVFGWTAEETVGKRINELNWIYPEDQPLVEQVMAEMLSGKRPHNVNRNRNVRKDGVVIHCEWYNSTLIDPSGAFSVLSLVLDVTERKRAEEALRESEGRYRTLFDTLIEGFCIIEVVFNADGEPIDYRFLEVNPAFEGQTGLLNARGRLMRELAPLHEAYWFEIYGDVALTGRPARFVSESRALGRWHDVSAYRIGGAESRKVAILFNDITERKRAEDAVREANARLTEADRRRSEFLGMLSHELRNPLTPVRNSLYILDRATPGGEQARRAHSVIDRQVGHLGRLVDDLLDVTRIDQGKIRLQRTRIDLVDLVRRTVEDHRSVLEEHEVAVELPKEAIWFNGDPTRLAQVLGNLLNNAAKFTPLDGKVSVSLTRAEGCAVLEVSDAGLGIDSETLERLFEPFAQADRSLDRSRGGLGLGLALVKGLVELHGGEVSAHSDGPGQGARFSIKLPLEEHVAAAQHSPQPHARARAGRKVLIIEDNRDAADSLSEVLKLSGHRVAVAYTGDAGLAKAREFRPEVVLCDIGLPGMDGYSVAKAMRVEPALKSVTLVALTGYVGSEDVAKSREAGFDHHLAKPPSLEALEQVLSSLAPEPPGHSPGR
jgi:PAS domain S-box-containing protein